MTDRDLALALGQIQRLERVLADAMQTDDLAERDQAVNVRRIVIATRRSLETWIGIRALRAQLAPSRAEVVA